jgi:hypothetical protein
MAHVIEDGHSTRKAWLLRRAGWALIALTTLAVCYVQYLQSGMSGISHGVGMVAGALLIAGGLAWLFTRKSSDVAKATGTLLASLIMALSLGMTTWDDYRGHLKAKDYMAKLFGLLDDQNKQSAAMEARFAAIPLDNVLSPEMLVNPGSRALAHERLAQMDTLLLERRELNAKFTAEVEALVNSFPGTEASAGFLEGKKNASAVFRPIDESQVQFVRLAKEVLEWAERQPSGSMGIADGRLLLATQVQIDEHTKMLEALADNGVAQERALAQGLEFRERSLGALEKLR